MRYDPREEYRQYLGWRDWAAQCHQSCRIRILSTVQDQATPALCAQLALDFPTLLWIRSRLQGDSEGWVRAIISYEPVAVWNHYYDREVSESHVLPSSFSWYRQQGQGIHLKQTVQRQPHSLIAGSRWHSALRILAIPPTPFLWMSVHWASNTQQQGIEYAEILWNPRRLIPDLHETTETTWLAPLTSSISIRQHFNRLVAESILSRTHIIG